MADATGDMDRPGAGPNSVNLVNPFTGMLATSTTIRTHSPESMSVKPNPPGGADEVLVEFDTAEQEKQWFSRLLCKRTIAAGCVRGHTRFASGRGIFDPSETEFPPKSNTPEGRFAMKRKLFTVE
jgi:hypothetical protein